MAYTFDGPNKLIIMNDTADFQIKDLYSRWKEWVLEGTNSTYLPAFRVVGGDPIGGGNSIASYYFLNNADGWRIRPYEADYELVITGNLYAEDPLTTMIDPPLGDYTVTVVIERSAAAIAVTVGGIDQATVQAAMTAQGYTPSRAENLDEIGQGSLTDAQATMLLEMYKLMGLDPTKPLVVTASSRRVPANGSEINQTISDDAGTVTVTRT